MTVAVARIYYDFVDPLSYLAALEWPGVVTDRGLQGEWIPFELRPPPTPLVTVDDAAVAARWEMARTVGGERGVSFAPPRLVPWTRKAHELVRHAAEAGADEGALRRRLFEAYLLEGRDIGRVDVLLDLARTASLDPTETKAVLDVDRWERTIAGFAEEARRDGVTDAPSLVVDRRRLQGFHNASALRTFLGTPGPEATADGTGRSETSA